MANSTMDCNNGRTKHGGMGWRNVYCSRIMEEWGGACINSTMVLIMDAEAWRNGVA